MHKLKTKIKIIWNILFRYEHFVLLHVDRKNLENLIQDKDVDVQMMYVGLRPYLFFKLIKETGAMKSDIDMVLDKAQFEADAILHSQNNKK